MKYLFIPSPTGSHVRRADETRGILVQATPNGVQQNPHITYVDPLDFDEIVTNIDILANVQYVKSEMINQVEQVWNDLVQNGIQVSSYTLRCAESDRNAFAQLLIMLNEAERVNSLPSTVPIIDASDTVHNLSVANARLLLVSYGLNYQNMWTTKVNTISLINNATTIEELNAININL